MHLCSIPEDKITDLEIPNGLPLIYDVKSKCVKLLDDGTGRNPLEVYNFGKAASYLFRPCTDENGNIDEECQLDLSRLSSTKNMVQLSADDQAMINAIRNGKLSGIAGSSGSISIV
jgi:hypothetical protein